MFKNRAEKREIVVQAVCRQGVEKVVWSDPWVRKHREKGSENVQSWKTFFSTKKRERMTGILRTRARPLWSN